jgi:hypothetical protein
LRFDVIEVRSARAAIGETRKQPSGRGCFDLDPNGDHIESCLRGPITSREYLTDLSVSVWTPARFI